MGFLQNLKIKTIGVPFGVLLGVLVIPRAGFSLDLGLTPSHVFSLWTNINENLIVVGSVVSDEPAWRKKLAASQTRKFEGKSPSDVLKRVVNYRTKLDRLLHRQALKPTKKFYSEEATITPSDVYLNSGHVLNAQVTWLIVNTGPQQTVSQFYKRHNFQGKTPSDVFGLVELANHRLDLILAQAGL